MLLTACGSNAEKGGSNAENKTDPPKSGINEPVELVFYTDTGMPVDEFNQKIGDPLKKKFPLLTVKYNRKGPGFTMQELLASGSAIDITWDSNFDAITDMSLAYDMTDLIKAAGINLGSFEPGIIEYAKNMSGGGKIYGLPVLMDTLVLYYNKDIFDKFGVPYLKDGMTWDEILGISKRLTVNDGTKQYVGFSVSPGHIVRMNQLSQPYIDTTTDKVTFDHENWKKILETTIIQPNASDGYRAKLQQLNRLPNTGNFLNDKDLAMWVFLSNMYYANTPEVMDSLNWDMVALPSFKEKPRVGSQVQAYFFSVTATSKHKAQATEVIKYLTSEEYQLDWAKKGALSPLKSETIKKSYGLDSRYKDKNFAALYYNQYAPIPKRSPYNSLAESALTKRMVDMALGKTDINTALRTAAEEANKAIEAAKAAKGAGKQ
jgi:multiple sugar transport system substrate-binding protein